MAFNPFHAFQKNKKFWMAAVLLITMVTFIFCMGRGGMEDQILNMFRKRGTTVLTVGSYQLSMQDLYKLRSDRNMVNEYMMKCTRIASDQLAKMYDDEAKSGQKKAKEQQAALGKIMQLQATLNERLRHPRFFEGGVKLDDLIEFKTWQTQADRLGIKVLDQDLETMVNMQFLVGIPPQQMLEAQAQARGSKDVSDAQFRRALTEEFRVRMARLAIIEAQVGRFNQQSTQDALVDPNRPDEQRAHVTLAQLWQVFQDKRSEMDIALIPVHVDDFTKEVFAQKPPTDAELESLYQQYRKEKYDPASPLPSFESPMEVKVEYVMADPTSPKYLAAARAKLVVEGLLPQLSLLGSPLQSPTVAAARAGAFAAGQQKIIEDVREGMSMPKMFELYRTADLGAGQFIWPMAAYFAEREPRAIASLVGNATASLGNPGLPGVPAWAGFLGEVSVPTEPGNAPAPASHAAEIEAGLAVEVKRRTVPYATVAASGAIGEPAGMAAAAFLALKLQSFQGNLYSEQLLLPTPVIERDLKQVIVNRTAEQRASRNLLAVKKLLDKKTGNKEAVKRVLDDVVPKYELTHVVSKRYYNRYDIAKAPELRALRDAYEKYYQQIDWLEKRDINPDRLLKETDFDKLFFDNESFSSTGKYQIKPWPPEVQPNPLQVRTMPGEAPDMPNIPGDVLADVQRAMQQQDAGQPKRFSLLDKAQKPILFWRADDKPPEVPQTLAAARERVVAAWKLEKARELKAIPTAKKIAEELLPASGDYTSEVLRKASELGGRAPIDLPHLAPLVPKDVGENVGGRREYFPYQLPKDKVLLPDPDMVADLLSLYDLKKPIEIKWRRTDGTPAFVKDVNDLNQALFDKAKKEKKKGVFVQVLTNLPQNIYYVAVVRLPPHADATQFADAIQWASINMFRAVDRFVPRAQVVLAKEFHGELLKQIQTGLGKERFKDNIDAKDRLEFDKSADIGG